MPDDEREMSIPELLEARERVGDQISKGRIHSSGDKSVTEELEAILAEIEAELAERGYKDAQGS